MKLHAFVALACVLAAASRPIQDSGISEHKSWSRLDYIDYELVLQAMSAVWPTTWLGRIRP